MKRTKKLAGAVLALALLTACTQRAGAPGSDAADGASPPEDTLPAGLSWAVAPTFAFDDLRPVTRSRGDGGQPFNTRGAVCADGLSEVYQNGKYGLIDHDGVWAVPCEFDWISCGYGGRYALTKYKNTADGAAHWFVLDENGLRQADGDGGPDSAYVSVSGTTAEPSLCWVVPDGALALRSEGGCVDPIPDWMGAVDYPVRALCMESSALTLQEGAEDGQKHYLYNHLSGTEEYVLYDGRGGVVPGRWEAVGCVAEGIVPVRKGGQWGYIDTAGGTVFPFEYDESGTCVSDLGEVMPFGCVNATEATVVLCRDGAYALYTVSGEALIPFGAFERLLPLHGGRLWAKQDGKWGVLRVDV